MVRLSYLQSNTFLHGIKYRYCYANTFRRSLRVPFTRGKDLALEYKVEPFLRALFQYDVQSGEIDNITPTKEMAMLAQRTKEANANKLKGASASPRMSPSSKRARSSSAKPSGSQTFSAPSMTPSPLHPSFNASSPSIPPSPQWHTDPPPRKRVKGSPQTYDHDYPPHQDTMEYDIPGPSSGLSHPPLQLPTEEPLEGAEKYRSILMSIFLSDDTEQVPDLLADPTVPHDLDIDLVIDDQGHTALHWAAALARIPVLELLVQKQADVRRVNFNGESALVRAVLVTNNFDKQSFPRLLSILHDAIPIVDRKNRTILHHIAVTAGIRGRGSSSHYYMECLLEWIARNGGDFSSIVDVQDKNGDTALTIAARVGDRYLAKLLMDVGANREIENKVGLKAEDFGIVAATVSTEISLLFTVDSTCAISDPFFLYILYSRVYGCCFRIQLVWTSREPTLRSSHLCRCQQLQGAPIWKEGQRDHVR